MDNNTVRLKKLVSQGEIKRTVKTLALKISSDYKDCHDGVLLVGVLKGAYIFIADLTREITCDIEVDFIRTSRYRAGTGVSMEPGEVKFLKDVDTDLEGRHVIIVEDIVDEGKTLEAVIKNIKKRNPKSLKVCSLLVRRGFKNENYKVDYKGKIISRGFVVGYGMDYNGRYRNRKEIYMLEEKGK